jgi:hypothetical protein
MLSFMIAICLAAQPASLTETQADALLLAILEAEQPENLPLPIELGPALERFWDSQELYTGLYRKEWTQGLLISEIDWTRREWPNASPPLAEATLLPRYEDAIRAITVCQSLWAELAELEGLMPEWNAAAIAMRRAEIDACLCLCHEITSFNTSRKSNTANARRSLANIRLMVGDQAYYSGGSGWPLYPWWHIPRSR